jgi:cell volume regulation protein A
MIETYNGVLMVIALLAIVSIVSTLFSLRAGAPILLVFLVVGFLAGEDGLGNIDFDNAEAAFVIGSVALALVLFDSGFGTPWRTFRLAAAPALTLATIGVLLTAGLVAVAAHYLAGLGWPQALLLGAILGSTDAAAVFFLLRVGGIRVRERVRATLEVESGSNDPMAIFLVLGLVALLRSDAEAVGTAGVVGTATLSLFATQMGLGLALGFVGGHAIVRIVNRLELEGALYPLLVAALALAVFAATNLAGGSGFLAAYVAGLVAGNRRIRRGNELKRFQQGLTWLAQIAMFVTLGLLATPSEFPAVLVPGIVLGLVLAFVARPIATALCLAPFGFSRAEHVFIGWVGLRGAVSILLAILPLAYCIEGGQELFNLAFLMVLVSLVVQGWSIAPLARWLKLVIPERAGAIERIQLDLPSEAAHELVAYRLHEDSPLLGRSALPRWVKPALIVRDGQSIRSMRLDRLRAGDVIYVFVRPHRIPLLDRLIASPRPPDPGDREFFGEFEVDPHTPIDELADFYGAAVNSGKRGQSVKSFLEREFGDAIEVGDRIGLGSIELVVRRLDEERRVAEVGLSITRKP